MMMVAVGATTETITMRVAEVMASLTSDHKLALE